MFNVWPKPCKHDGSIQAARAFNKAKFLDSCSLPSRRASPSLPTSQLIDSESMMFFPLRVVNCVKPQDVWRLLGLKVLLPYVYRPLPFNIRFSYHFDRTLHDSFMDRFYVGGIFREGLFLSHQSSELAHRQVLKPSMQRHILSFPSSLLPPQVTDTNMYATFHLL